MSSLAHHVIGLEMLNVQVGIEEEEFEEICNLSRLTALKIWTHGGAGMGFRSDMAGMQMHLHAVHRC